MPLKGKSAQTECHYLQGKAWFSPRVLRALESFLWSLSLPRMFRYGGVKLLIDKNNGPLIILGYSNLSGMHLQCTRFVVNLF